MQHRPIGGCPRQEAGRRAPGGEVHPSAEHRGMPAAAPRGHDALARENGGAVPWCGPAVIALATGCDPLEACDLLRATTAHWYPGSGPVVTAYWRDLLTVLARRGVPHQPISPEPGPRPALIAFLRRGGEAGQALPPGWYLLRVTGHFLVLRSHGFGLGLVHDNRHSGALVTARLLGRRRITHAAQLFGGPLLHG